MRGSPVDAAWYRSAQHPLGVAASTGGPAFFYRGRPRSITPPGHPCVDSRPQPAVPCRAPPCPAFLPPPVRAIMPRIYPKFPSTKGRRAGARDKDSTGRAIRLIMNCGGRKQWVPVKPVRPSRALPCDAPQRAAAGRRKRARSPAACVDRVECKTNHRSGRVTCRVKKATRTCATPCGDATARIRIANAAVRQLHQKYGRKVKAVLTKLEGEKKKQLVHARNCVLARYRRPEDERERSDLLARVDAVQAADAVSDGDRRFLEEFMHEVRVSHVVYFTDLAAAMRREEAAESAVAAYQTYLEKRVSSRPTNSAAVIDDYLAAWAEDVAATLKACSTDEKMVFFLTKVRAEIAEVRRCVGLDAALKCLRRWDPRRMSVSRAHAAAVLQHILRESRAITEHAMAPTAEEEAKYASVAAGPSQPRARGRRRTRTRAGDDGDDGDDEVMSGGDDGEPTPITATVKAGGDDGVMGDDDDENPSTIVLDSESEDGAEENPGAEPTVAST